MTDEQIAGELMTTTDDVAARATEIDGVPACSPPRARTAPSSRVGRGFAVRVFGGSVGVSTDRRGAYRDSSPRH
jgi:hypothetical protein